MVFLRDWFLEVCFVVFSLCSVFVFCLKLRKTTAMKGQGSGLCSQWYTNMYRWYVWGGWRFHLPLTFQAALKITISVDKDVFRRGSKQQLESRGSCGSAELLFCCFPKTSDLLQSLAGRSLQLRQPSTPLFRRCFQR